MPLEVIAAGNRDAMIDAAQVQVVVSFPAFTLLVGNPNALREGQVGRPRVSLAQAHA